MTDAPLTLLLAGDTFLTVPWSGVEEPAFAALVAQMRAADATIVNLETVIHSFAGHAQAQSGGTWAASPPEIAAELAWAGVDMVAHSNNHAFDYGSAGVTETVSNVEAAGIVHAGSGIDLQRARAPAFFKAAGRTIAHVAMASTFVPFGKASRSRADVAGRPGVNPLAVSRRTELTVPPVVAAVLRRIDGWLGRDTIRYGKPQFRRFGWHFTIGNAIRFRRGKLPLQADRVGNLAAIAEAAGKSDVVVVSIHSHDHSRWLMRFIGEAIDAGAGIVVVHGVHRVRGVAFFKGRPVFLGLGDFAYQVRQIARFPAEAYDQYTLGDDATPADLAAEVAKGVLERDRKVFEGCAALLRFAGGRLEAIELLPLDLGFESSAFDRGRPRLADGILGSRIIGEIAALSKPLGTAVRYDADRNCGSVEIPFG